MMLAALVLAIAQSATLEPGAREAQIGEPVLWTLTVEHPAKSKVTLPEGWPLLDGSWVVLDTGLVRRSIGADGNATTTATWQVMSLEPGERALPELAVAVGDEIVTAKPSPVTVRAALAQGEDEARPIEGFLPPPEPTGARGVLVTIASLVVALIAFVIWRAMRKRRKPVAVPQPTPLEELGALRARARAEPQSARKVTYAAVALLRRAIDEHVGEERSASPDDEWLSRVEPDDRIPLGVRSSAARVLRDAEHVKYALAMPTPFALEEMLASTESALAALAEAPLEKRAEVAA